MTTTIANPNEIHVLPSELKLSEYWVHNPTEVQISFLYLKCIEAMFGGAAGGGKTDALLDAALQYVDVPGYSAIIFRRTYPELSNSDGLIPRALEWLAPTDARWNQGRHTWTWPTGATLTFAHINAELDVFKYHSAAYQFIGFDELTTFTETMYRYMFSRLRRLVGSDIPLRVRSASNPGGIGHAWVKQAFITEGMSEGRVFVPARLDDNPYLDRESYIKSLDRLDPVTKARLLRGDWDAVATGAMFQRENFEIVDEAPAEARRLRFWDLAATVPRPGNPDPDYTRGCRLAVLDGVFYIEDMAGLRGNPAMVEALIKQTAELDGRKIAIRMEQEPGASGVNTIGHYARRVLLGFDFRGRRSTGKKAERARPVAASVGAKNVKLVRGPWISAFLDEAEAFTGVEGKGHDDQVDALSGAHTELVGRGEWGAV